MLLMLTMIFGNYEFLSHCLSTRLYQLLASILHGDMALHWSHDAGAALWLVSQQQKRDLRDLHVVIPRKDGCDRATKGSKYNTPGGASC